MKTSICVLVFFALASTLEAKPSRVILGPGKTSGEVAVETPQGAGGAAPVGQAGVTANNSRGGAGIIHSSSSSNSGSSSGETNSNSNSQQAAGGDAGDTPDTTDGPDGSDVDSVNGAPIVAQGGVAFGGQGGSGGKPAASSTPKPNAAAPGLIVSDSSSGSAAIAVIAVIGVIGIAAGVGFFIYKRK